VIYFGICKEYLSAFKDISEFLHMAIVALSVNEEQFWQLGTITIKAGTLGLN
jgi:hypothetical protein